MKLDQKQQEKEPQLIYLIDEVIEATKLQEEVYYSLILGALNKLRKVYLDKEEARRTCIGLVRALENPMIDKVVESKVFDATDYYLENFIIF